MTTITIAAVVELCEAHHLAEHFRNRSLVNAQRAFDLERANAALTQQVEDQTKEIEDLRVAMASTGISINEEERA